MSTASCPSLAESVAAPSRPRFFIFRWVLPSCSSSSFSRVSASTKYTLLSLALCQLLQHFISLVTTTASDFFHAARLPPSISRVVLETAEVAETIYPVFSLCGAVASAYSSASIRLSHFVSTSRKERSYNYVHYLLRVGRVAVNSVESPTVPAQFSSAACANGARSVALCASSNLKANADELTFCGAPEHFSSISRSLRPKYTENVCVLELLMAGRKASEPKGQQPLPVICMLVWVGLQKSQRVTWAQLCYGQMVTSSIVLV